VAPSAFFAAVAAAVRVRSKVSSGWCSAQIREIVRPDWPISAAMALRLRS